MPARWPRNQSLCVAMSIYDTVESRTMRSLMSLQRSVNPKKFDLHLRHGTYIDLSRSTIAQETKGSDYVLYLDSDIVFRPSDAAELYAAMRPEYGAISASYPFRDGSGRTTFGWKRPDGEWMTDQEATQKCMAHIKAGDRLVPVDKMGAGFLLVPGHTLRRLPAPAFACRWLEDEIEGVGKVRRFVGEDVYFVELLQSLGYTPMAHMGVQVGHIGKIVLGMTGVTLYADSTQMQ